MPQTSDKIILPQKYYLDYFRYLLTFVEAHYGQVLGTPEHDFISAFRQLSEPAQLLFVRFSNRKGPLYRLSKIQYEEIPDPETAANELEAGAFISEQIPNVYEAFNLFTRNELWSHFSDRLKDLKQAKKIEWIEYLIGDEVSYLELPAKDRIVEVQKRRDFEFLKLLFFGTYKAQMTEFVIRDIGNVRLEKLDESRFSAWCQSREEALAFFEVSELKSLISKAMKVFPALEIQETLTDVNWQEFGRHPHASRAMGKLCITFGQQLEREGANDLALHYYGLTNMPPARERRVRILDKQGHLEPATQLAIEMLESYQNATERIFAKDFLSRPKVRINRSMTARLSDAPLVTLQARQHEDRVERLAIQHFVQQGFEGLHAENFIWRNLFGLIFWEELFDQSRDSFHHPLQRIPADIYESFFEKRATSLISIMDRLKTRKLLKNKIRKLLLEKRGVANPFVYWYEDMSTHLELVLDFLGPRQLGAVLLEMAKNPKDNTKGFPDLFIWNELDYHFYEIKSPNDHLSAQQLFWIEFMQDQGIKADILRVEYENNP